MKNFIQLYEMWFLQCGRELNRLLFGRHQISALGTEQRHMATLISQAMCCHWQHVGK